MHPHPRLRLRRIGKASFLPFSLFSPVSCLVTRSLMIDQLLQNSVVSSPIPFPTRPRAPWPLALTARPTSSSSASDCSSGSWSASTKRDRQAPTKNRLPAAPSASLRTSGTGIFGARLFVDVDVSRHTFCSRTDPHPLMMTIRSRSQALSRRVSTGTAPCLPGPRTSLLPCTTPLEAQRAAAACYLAERRL